jgi:BlaI family penicillinase repressor
MNRAPRKIRSLFTALEQEVMESIWKRGMATAEQVRGDLAPKRVLQESTVRTLLKRLEAKGHLRHRVEGRTFVYSSVENSRSFAIRAVQQIIERFCGGSAEQLVAGMVENDVLDEKQLRRLADEIARDRSHKKESRK